MLKTIIYWVAVGLIIELINFYLAPLIVKTVYLSGYSQANIGAGWSILLVFCVLMAIFAIIYQFLFKK